LGDYSVNLSTFEERSIILYSDEVPNQICHRIEDEFLVFVKSIPLLESIERSQMEHEIENLINLHHPCIAAPIGFVVRIESGDAQELKIVRLYLEGLSLFEVLSVRPVWWTSTVKAKAIAGIVLGLRYAHSLGLLHGHLTTSNILFDSDHCIQIVDFNPILMKLEVVENESESKEGKHLGDFSKGRWTPKTDVHAFASILFEIIVGQPANSQSSIPRSIPEFVSTIIESGLRSKSERKCSFHNIFEILKTNNFLIANSVDTSEVYAFVNRVKSAEYPKK
jgi:serine/threonine protein kinase